MNHLTSKLLSGEIQRILVIGAPGAGKSTLARRLGERTGLPVIHLDKEFWNPGWVETPADQWRERVRQLAAGERWIIDGSYSGTLPIRLARAQLVIHLDLPRRIYMRRILKRIFSSYGRTRDDMADGCPERLDWEFLRWAWKYGKRPRRLAYTYLTAANSDFELITVTSVSGVKSLFNQ